MTIPDLIQTVLGVIRNQFYPDTVRAYKRDERALMKAVARYGYECNQRGWQFDPKFMQREILQILQEIKRGGAEIQYLPLYLEGAVDRHIRQRAEELSRDSRGVKQAASRIVTRTNRVEAVVEATPVEILATVYRDLKRRTTATRSKTKKPEQGTLL